MNKARVLLLNPPTAAASTEVFLGLAYLASSLRKAGHTVKVVDATAPYNPFKPEEIEKAISKFRPHFIGVTLTIMFIPRTYAYLRSLRKLNIPIVAGGPYVNPLPNEVIQEGKVDIVSLGEGENTIVELADYFAGNGTRLEDINGLCIRRDEGPDYLTPPRPLIENLDDIPFPSFEDFPIRNYTGSDNPNSNPIFWSILSSRGCPFNCIFCCVNNVFGRGHRFRSAENVFAEIRYLTETFGARTFAFQDDEMLLSKKRLLRFCELVLENNLKIKMSVRARIDSIDTEILKRMREAGFVRIGFGIESFNDDTLKKINKRYRVKDIHRKFKELERADFPNIMFNNIAGFPWETKRHFNDNLKAIAALPKSIRFYSGVATPVPYPGTELYNRYNKEYGFTDWWLDIDKHPAPFLSAGKRPIFHRFSDVYLRGDKFAYYWNYTKKKKSDLQWFVVGVFKLSIRRILSLPEYILVYSLTRISYFLWCISPPLERALLGWVPEGFIKQMVYRLSFRNQS